MSCKLAVVLCAVLWTINLQINMTNVPYYKSAQPFSHAEQDNVQQFAYKFSLQVEKSMTKLGHQNTGI